MPKAEKTIEKSEYLELIEIKDLYQVMVTEGLDVLELKNAERRVKLSRQNDASVIYTPSRHAPTSRVLHGKASSTSEKAAAASGESIKAPLAGVFYRASSPASAAFVKEGDQVQAGQTLCIVEAMKVMNEIKAEKSCKIVKIAAENSRPVTVGQALFWID
jgi:acetyl-CoA carboxylase biotin carboxyl carrier protein